MRDDWTHAAKKEGIALDELAISRFARFAERLEATNQTLNLTRVPPEDYGIRHFLDSLLLLKFYRPERGAKVLDVGTGAGFPGIPLAIALPEVEFTLMDATRKRLNFLDDVIEELELANVRTLHTRAEDAAKLPAHRGRYLLVLSRAVAPLERLLGWTLPFVRSDNPNAFAVAYKSHDTDAELTEAQTVLKRERAVLSRIEETALPDTDAIRRFLFFAKTQPRTQTSRRSSSAS